ncbi:MAG: type II secretion system protein [Phycisphaerales bacterium]|nr:type II secretion system protein [Phycisphaerales bacterium]
MRSIKSHHGLTLVELLAAIIILSAMAAAAVSVQRDATSAARRAQRTNDALDVLQRCRSLPPQHSTSIPPSQQHEWSWTDEDGVTWLVRVDTSGQESANDESHDHDLDAIPWETIVVDRFDATSGLTVEALRVSRLSHETTASTDPGGV